MEKCPSCETENRELMWHQNGDTWVCLYCYNGNYTKEKIIKLRIKQDKKNKT